MKKFKMIVKPSPESLQGKTVTMINHALKGINYHIQIKKLQNIRGKVVNKYQIQESQKNNIQGIKYKDIVRNCVCQSDQDGQTILDQIQFCYQKKCRKSQILISKAILFTEECLQCFTNPENISELNHIITELYLTFIGIIQQFKLLAYLNYEPLFQYYPIKFLIDGLQKFREFYAYKFLTQDSYSQFIILNSLLCNFILGIVQQDIFINGSKLADAFHITGFQLTINSLKTIHMPRHFNKQKWKNFHKVLSQKSCFYFTLIHFICKTLKSKPISQIINQIDADLYQRFFSDYQHKIFCIFVPFWNLKGFATNRGFIFINLYPVIKEFNVLVEDLYELIQSYCLITVIIALDKIRNLKKWNGKIMPIESILSTSEFSHLDIYEQVFGINEQGDSNLKFLNIQTMKVIQQLDLKLDLQQFQIQLAKTQQEPSQGENIRFIN